MSQEYPLDGLALEIKAHWEKYRPTIYRQLEQEGQLRAGVDAERVGVAFATMADALVDQQSLDPGLDTESIMRAFLSLMVR